MVPTLDGPSIPLGICTCLSDGSQRLGIDLRRLCTVEGVCQDRKSVFIIASQLPTKSLPLSPTATYCYTPCPPHSSHEPSRAYPYLRLLPNQEKGIGRKEEEEIKVPTEVEEEVLTDFFFFIPLWFCFPNNLNLQHAISQCLLTQACKLSLLGG